MFSSSSRVTPTRQFSPGHAHTARMSKNDSIGIAAQVMAATAKRAVVLGSKEGIICEFPS